MLKSSIKRILKKLPGIKQIATRWSFIIDKLNALEKRVSVIEESSKPMLKTQSSKKSDSKWLLSVPFQPTIYTKHQIELVLGDRNWILEKMADAILSSNNVPESDFFIKKVGTPSGSADLSYFLPYTAGFYPQAAKVTCCNFTHQEAIQPGHDNFIKAAKSCSHCISLSQKYADVLTNSGVSVKKVSVIPLGVDSQLFKPKIHIGIVGRTYPHSKRKGEDLIRELLDIPEIEFHFTGSGWPLPSIEYADCDMPEFYNAMDYILIPSLIEGGPACVYEALACGIPIIGSDVGIVCEYPHIHFETGSIESLKKVLYGLIEERNVLRKTVERFTWERFGNEHMRVFRNLFQQNTADTCSLN